MLRSAQGVVVDAALLSDPGRDPDKQVNEDAIALTETGFGVVGVVCDGMGGHERGELASRTAVERILEVLKSGGPPLDRLISRAIERAHADVYALGGNAPAEARPGSTAVVVVVSGREALVGHVGDSRAYRVRARSLERLTRDHSVVEALLAAGAISVEQANLHPDANRITRALGIAPEIEPEVSPPLRVEAGDAFILSSDGLSDLVSDAEISEIVNVSPTPEAACQSLVALANQRGGHDNISVEVLRVLSLGNPSQQNPQSSGVAPTVPSEIRTASEAQTVIAQPGFTVLMGTKAGFSADPEGVPRGASPTPVDPGELSRGTSPTLVDPIVAETQKTVPQGHAPPATPPAATLLVPATNRAAAPRQPLPSVRAPRELAVRVLLWSTASLCALVLVVVLAWWWFR